MRGDDRGDRGDRAERGDWGDQGDRAERAERAVRTFYMAPIGSSLKLLPSERVSDLSRF